MKARPLWSCVQKECLLLGRDPHGLLLLFVMPAVFILIMSLALQEQFAGRGAGDGGYIDVLVQDREDNAASRRLIDRLGAHAAVNVIPVDKALDHDTLTQRLRSTGPAFAVRIDKGFGDALQSREGAPSGRLRVVVSPDADRPREHLLLGALREALGRLRISALITRIAPELAADVAGLETEPRVEYLYRHGSRSRAPSSVQQNVPAWLVFGVFFIVVPLSNTMIRERQLGMDLRLRTTPVSPATILAGKLLPYFLVNQLQVLAMLAVGMFLVPALGGDPLSLAGVPAAPLAVVAVALSLAALGYALLIAVVSRTTEQATMLGGAGNIILAAIGGIMVPKLIMPPALQTLTHASPMAWGLDGLMVPLLHGGGIAEAAPYVLTLTAFGLAAITFAWILQWRSQRY